MPAGCLDQLQVQRLLQCRGWVVCPEGLNGSLKALLFDFKELPLWNAANADEPTQDPPMIDVDLSGAEPEVPPSTRVEDPLSLNLRGALEQLQWASPAAPHSPSQYITSRTQLPSAALGAPSPARETENSLRSVGTEPVIPTLVVTLPQTSPQATPPGSSPGSAHSTQQPFWLTGPRTLEAGSMSYLCQVASGSSEGELTSLSKELLQLQEEMNIALKELLEVRASMDCHCRELDLGVELLCIIMMPSLPKPRHAMHATSCCPAMGSPGQHFSTESVKQWHRMGKNAKLSQRSSQQPSKPVHWRTAGHSCTPYNS